MRDTECFSMYSDMSTRIMLSSSPKSASASALHSSVLPTPVGPRKMKEPMGRWGSLRPARARRMARATDFTASCWPTTRSCSTFSRLINRFDSSSVSLDTGTPVQAATIWATSSSPTISTLLLRLCSQALRRADISFCNSFLRSRRCAAFSKSSSATASSVSLFSASSFACCCRMSGGAVKACMRTREAASSIRSMALSGRNRSEI